jgi:hypothetical protein
MKIKYLFIVALLFSALFNACKTDVDVIAPYRETAVVYGLLDISQGIQYIKINKVFLGKGDAFAMAQNPDSSNFNPDDMNITLDKYNGSDFIGTIILNDTILKDTILSGGASGSFSKEKNIIYYTKELLQENLTYKLKVENKKTGYKAESTTNVINLLNIEGGGSDWPFVLPNNSFNPKINIRWIAQKHAKIYELIFRFQYKEFKNGGDTVYKSIDWAFSPMYSSNTEGGEEMLKVVKGEEFYQFLKTVKDSYFADNSFKRIAYRGQILVTAAGEEFQIYKDLNAPYSSNFQEKPIYTNIVNGLGIFNSRVSASGIPKALTSSSINELVNGNYTNDLGFIRQ